MLLLDGVDVAVVHIGVEIGTFDDDVVLALNYTAVLKVSFALRGRFLTHFFNCCVAVDRKVTHNVPFDAADDKIDAAAESPIEKPHRLR